MRCWIHAFLVAALACLAPLPSRAEEGPDAGRRRELFEQLSREMAGGAVLELKELEIKAKIYEPQVIYILDRAKLEISPGDEQPRFTPRIPEPVVDDRL
jgi:hypothetical protein